MADQSKAPAHPPQPELLPAPLPEDDNDTDDADSALGVEDSASSTASVTSSILQYRTLHGRTFHSDKYKLEYFTPNDEQQAESVDITHHYCTLLLGGKLFLAPIDKDIEKVVDIGTGTGIWAMDFADEFPNAEVIGTDLSPIQPSWVPPNLKFELEDATQTWTWQDDTFDYVHIRQLVGTADWNALFREAYRCCKPGGWVESSEIDPIWFSDDGTIDETYGIQKWNELFQEAGKCGISFCPVQDDLQMKGMKAAGFADLQQVTYKVPVGGWPRDPKMSEVGQFLKLAIENDIQGYTLQVWHNIMHWPETEYQLFLMEMRKALRNKSLHGYLKIRHVYGRKSQVGGPSAV